MVPLDAPMWSEQIRLKVFEPNENHWLDKGIGFCHGTLLLDIKPVIAVTSEWGAEHHLLMRDISKDDRYHKRHDTLIIWTDPAGNDMALSFEKIEGCARIWDFVTEVQRRLVEGQPLG